MSDNPFSNRFVKATVAGLVAFVATLAFCRVTPAQPIGEELTECICTGEFPGEQCWCNEEGVVVWSWDGQDRLTQVRSRIDERAHLVNVWEWRGDENRPRLIEKREWVVSSTGLRWVLIDYDFDDHPDWVCPETFNYDRHCLNWWEFEAYHY